MAWLAEEVGELAQAVRKGTHEQQVHEFGDVIAWVATLANQLGVDLNAAVERYADGCPKCGVASRCGACASSGQTSSSAIWIAFRAAPLRRLSLLTNSARPRPSATPSSWRIRPT